MPSRGPDGKPLSGAALRKRKQQQDAATKAREAKRKKAASPAPALVPPAVQPVGLDFNMLPPPPLGDPLAAMGWFNDLLLVCADKVIRDGLMPLEQKVRFLSDFSAKAGMVR